MTMVRPYVCTVPDTTPVQWFEGVEDHVGQGEPVDVPEDVYRPVDCTYPFPVKLEIVPGS